MFETFFGKYQILFDKSKAVMLIIDPETARIVKANPIACSFYGYKAEELEQMSINDINPLSAEDMSNEIQAAKNEKRNYFNFKHKLQNGEIRDVEVFSNPFECQEKIYLFSIIHDISPQYKAQKELDHRIKHDVLSNLPNRHFSNLYIENLITQCQLESLQFALILFDLDNWKRIKDTYDHHIGDLLILQLANRFSSILEKNEILTHHGGDEFLFIIENLNNIDEITPIISRIQTEVNKPFLINDNLIKLKGSNGIVVYPSSGNTAKELLRNATISVHRAKKENPGSFIFYSKDMHEHLLQQTLLEDDLSLAINNDEFILFYQPVIDIKNGIIAGFEALLRWKHPKRGLLTPDYFLPMAEKSKMILPIDQWVFQNACDNQKSISKKVGLDINVSINISTHHFQNYSVIQKIQRILQELDMDPQLLTFEITESAMMNDIKTSAMVMQKLHNLGVKIAIDDFGSGYSSLNYLASLPFDIIKIDRSFLKNIPCDKRAVSLISSIHGLARGLGKKVIIEGVENSEQLNFLYNEGLYLIQGFYFSKPLSQSSTREYIAKLNIANQIRASIPDWAPAMS